MPLEQIANIAEIVGMIVVAVTFIFLTLQMRQNTKALRSAAANTRSQYSDDYLEPHQHSFTLA